MKKLFLILAFLICTITNYSFAMEKFNDTSNQTSTEPSSLYALLKQKYKDRHLKRETKRSTPLGHEFEAKKSTINNKTDHIKHLLNRTINTMDTMNTADTKTDQSAQDTPPFTLKTIALDPETENLVKKITISHKKLMYESLYNNTFGFYNAGKIEISERGAFITHPVMLSPHFGAMIAYNAYAMCRSMILSRDLAQNDRFEIFEIGAGDGTLAHDIIKFVSYMSLEETTQGYKRHWSDFYGRLQYTIGEISPALIEKQKAKNKLNIYFGKLQIIKLDARAIEKSFKDRKIKGLVLSNELPDAFPVHKIVKRDKQLKTIAAIASYNKAHSKILFDQQNTINRIIEQSNDIKKSLQTINIPVDEDTIILSAQTYFTLKETAEKQKKDINQYIDFHEIEIDACAFPEIHEYLKRHGNYIMLVSKNGSCHYINDGLERYMKSVSEIIDTGFIITIDYGDSAPLLHTYTDNKTKTKNIRFFHVDKKEVSNIYQCPGEADITTDVNFTELAMVGKMLGLETVFYGKEKELFGNLLLLDKEKKICMKKFDIDADVLPKKNIRFRPSAELEEKYDNSKGNFRVLIQKTSKTNSGFTILAKQKNVFYDDFNKVNLVNLIASKRKNHLITYILQTKEIPINNQNKCGDTLLHVATKSNNTEIATLLLKKDGIKINIQNRNGDTPLHLALTRENNDIIELLLQKENIAINIQNNNQETPLHIAVRTGQARWVAQLLNNKNIDYSLENDWCNTPYDTALSTGNEEIISLFNTI